MDVIDLEYWRECVSRGDGRVDVISCGDGGGCGCGDGDGYGDRYSDDGHGDGDGDGFNYICSDDCDCDSGLHYIDHSTPVLAYWVFGEESCCRDGRCIPPKPGDIHTYDAPIKLGYRGLRASPELEDETRHRKGDVFRVACSGFVLFDYEEFVCTRRVVLEKREVES